MYSDLVLDHFSDPRNVGEIEDADGVGDFGDAECGDVARITISVDEHDRITDVRFKAFGCGAAVASSSMATELAMGRSLTESAAITNTTVAEALGGLPAHKMHCSNMAADALHLAIRDYLVRSGREAEIAEVMTPHPKAEAPSSL